MENIFITGGLGFIGSNFVHIFLQNFNDCNIVILDKYTYAANENNIGEVIDKVKIIKIDIFNKNNLKELFIKYKPSLVVNFAAETHVDNSIESDDVFVDSNIVGTKNLLECVNYLNLKENVFCKILHVSTDEVYGPKLNNFTKEGDPYNPKNPYAASKAASDHFCSSYKNTFKTPVVVVNCSNNYGPRQNKEKLIPKTIHAIYNNLPIPIYGSGKQIRDWLFVEDCCEAIISLIKNIDFSSEDFQFNIGSNSIIFPKEITNLEIIDLIGNIMNIKPNLKFVEDRKGHDFRYALSSDKIKKYWTAKTPLVDGLEKTIKWYLNG